MLSVNVIVVPPPKDTVAGFAQWVAESCGSGMRTLNIGAGKNLSGGLRPVTRRMTYMVGVDPDPSIHDNPSLHERHQMSLETFATDHAAEFDIAFAVYVLEHVAAPAAFMAACARVLKPGGSLFALTLNRCQYFGLLTWASTRLGASDWLLARLKPPDVIAQYHFVTEYRLNSIRKVSRRLEQAGFRAVEFRCYDAPDRYRWYLPSVLHWFPDVYSKAAYVVRRPSLMGHLSFRADLPTSAASSSRFSS